ncbi:hypothetical protein WJX81_003185 [Elliptochloris bilobata]|uniref:Nuclear pore protein n=1 Tax=Elliptochloris bilobata TaxID=381761 RepID=A0AAW1QNF8_9CHLO
MTKQDGVADGGLNALEFFLRQPDAIMEANILDVLRRYVADGGQPPTVVEYLSENYVGYAQMASLVVSWTRMLDEVQAAAEDRPQAEFEHDEASFLRELVKQKFEPDKFAGVFTRGGSGPPRWLDGLLQDRAGRQLVYELSAAHRGCLLLNYAIQKVLRAGHEGEVAGVGASLASYFGVFHRLLANRLREVPGAAAPRLSTLAAELQETCCGGEHTYAHAQQMLTALGRHPHGARFRRLAQELEAHATASAGPVVWQMARWFSPQDHRRGRAEAAAAVCDLLTAAAAADRSGLRSGVGRLHALYMDAEPPPVDVIRHPKVIEALLYGVFARGSPLGADKDAYVAVLAMAAAAVDDRPAGWLDTADVEPTAAALRQALSLAHSASTNGNYGPREQARAEAAAACPVAAAGLVRCMRPELGGAMFWRGHHGSGVPAYVRALALIIPAQPLLHAQIVGVLADALRGVGNARPDAARALLGLALALLTAGQTGAVLAAAERWARGADPSLVRHFVFGALDVAAPPYSPEFAASLIRLMQGSGVRRSRSGVRDSKVIARLEDFAAACAQVRFKPPLSTREAAFLQELQTERMF